MTNPKAAVLIQNYSDENLWKFINERNHSLTRAFEPIQDLAHDDTFSEIRKLGEIEFSVSERLLVCSVAVARSLNERSGKKAQYDLAKKILGQYNNDFDGIFVFHDPEGNFRFSLIYRDFVGNRQKLSNYRRFTYYVSPQLTNKTFLQRIGEADFSTLQNIKDSFSVEVVTDKFFKEFRNIFDRSRKEFEQVNKNTVCLWLESKYEDDEYKEQVNKFIFTFLGRIIFLYFLLRKGWVEDKIDFIRLKVEDDSIHNLYQNVFEPLFFEVFAKQEKDRSPEIKEQYKNTPYLNGGLFEHSDLETEMAKEGKFILFRDEFLRDIILNYFEIYNFTVDENSPNDQEVSIDPEMLGKVFENTLAEEERNKKGTFYTPREIVHFMVKDSIRQYLHNETGIDLGLLQKFIYNEDDDLAFFTPNQIRLIDSKLETIKVLDPAVGSAAFPVEFMQVIIELRKRLDVRVGKHINEVALKKQLIKNNLYGVDIDPSAIEIAKLRLWLALIVDYDKTLAEPLPNLDFQFRVGNSLQEKIDDIDIFNESTAIGQMDWTKQGDQFEILKSKMIRIKDQFYTTNDETRRHHLKDEFDAFEHQLIQSVLASYEKKLQEQLANRDYRKSADYAKQTLKKIDSLEQKIKDGTYKLFKPEFHFSEVFDRMDEEGNKIGGFDIVIGNPPYGVTIDNDIKDWHELGSRDSYGVFISTALKRFLKPNGILEFIVSDTWLTIKSHKPLREQVLSKQFHKVVRLHQDCFDATVNACIISVTNKESTNNKISVADTTNISTRDEIDLLRPILYKLDDFVGQSTPIFGVYKYDQKRIFINSNIPIFVGSPFLYEIMNDATIIPYEKFISSEKVFVRSYRIYEKDIEVANLGATYYRENNKKIWNNDGLAKIVSGIKTGKNQKYLRMLEKVDKSFKTVEEETILLSTEWADISEDEKINGVFNNGKYFINFEMGKSSDTSDSYLPNYYQEPSVIFINWSRRAVQSMKSEAHSDLANGEFRFRKGLSMSRIGQYAPTFRIGVAPIFDSAVPKIFCDFLDDYFLLGVLCSKMFKFLFKQYVDHTVSSQVEEIKNVPIVCCEDSRIKDLVISIIEKQKENPRYDYMNNEQKKIDELVYKLYGLNQEDIQEVETWYARRYPKLAHLCDI